MVHCSLIFNLLIETLLVGLPGGIGERRDISEPKWNEIPCGTLGCSYLCREPSQNCVVATGKSFKYTVLTALVWED